MMTRNHFFQGSIFLISFSFVVTLSIVYDIDTLLVESMRIKNFAMRECLERISHSWNSRAELPKVLRSAECLSLHPIVLFDLNSIHCHNWKRRLEHGLMLNLKVGGLTGGSGEGEEKQGSPGDHHHHHLGTIKITITIIKGIATITTSTTTHTKVRSRKYTHYSIYCQICHKILPTSLFYIRFGFFSSPFRLSKWLSTFPDIMCHNFASCSEEIPSVSVPYQ